MRTSPTTASMDQLYAYQQLPDARTYVRILNILGRDDDHVLSLTLKTVKLASVDNEYDAISYVWGPATPLKLVRIDGRKFKLRENIWRFLNYCCDTNFRYEHHQNLWIDAICINQEDAQEKSQQVQSMRHVFASARRVLCWLGDTSEKSVDIDNLTDPDTTLAEMQDRMKFFFSDDFQLDPPDYTEVETRRLCEAVLPILINKYRSRLWIVQEVCLARSALVILSIGLVHVHRMSEMYHTLPFLNSELYVRDPLVQQGITHLTHIETMLYNSEDRRRPVRTADHVDLLHTCVLLLHFACQDPRDHLFAILGLVDGEFLADYSERPGELLRRLLIFTATQKRPFSIGNFLEVNKVLMSASSESTKELEYPISIPTSQTYVIQFVLESCFGFSSVRCHTHSSIESWITCLVPPKPFPGSSYGLNSTDLKCHCNSPWPGGAGITEATGSTLYTRIAFSILIHNPSPWHSAKKIWPRDFLLLAIPIESFEPSAPSLLTGLVLKENKKTSCQRYTAHELSSPLQEDLRAYFTWYIIEKLRAQIDVVEGLYSVFFSVPVRAESLAQLCDIYK